MSKQQPAKQQSGERKTGVTKWFNETKGFGFIKPDDGGEDVFVHHSKIDMDGFRTLEEGARVSYTPVKSDKGIAAEGVRTL